MAEHAKRLWKDILISVATIVVTMIATLFAAHLPLPPGVKYHDHNPIGWVPFFGIPVITVAVAAKLGMNWKRYAAVLTATFVAAFLLAWIVFSILAFFR